MPPVVIAAGIGAAASIGGGLLSSRAQKKAAGKAARSAENTAAANNALAREQMQFSAARLDPYSQRGNMAGDAINSLLGLGMSDSAKWTTYLKENPDVAAEAMTVDKSQFATPEAYGQWHYGKYGQSENRPLTTGNAGGANNAFQNYLNSTGYQFQVDQGAKAINQNYAASGSLQSGAALKALQTYGQNTATGFFKDYLGLLANQQGVGLSGASAVAGVGQNYVNSVSANNNAAGTAAQNAYLTQGNANANMWGNVAGAIGGVANAFGSSYRPRG